MAEAQSTTAGSKCQFGDVGKDLRRAGKGKRTNLNRLNRCWICLANLRRLYKNESWRSSSIWGEFKRNRLSEPRSESPLVQYPSPQPYSDFRLWGTVRTCQVRLAMSVLRSEADLPVARPDIRL